MCKYIHFLLLINGNKILGKINRQRTIAQGALNISYPLSDMLVQQFYRRKLHCFTIYHKMINTRTPSYLHNKIKFRSDIHKVNIKKKHDKFPTNRTTFRKTLKH